MRSNTSAKLTATQRKLVDRSCRISLKTSVAGRVHWNRRLLSRERLGMFFHVPLPRDVRASVLVTRETPAEGGSVKQLDRGLETLVVHLRTTS